MDNESEVIRHQMEETRASLADKLETLEREVTETVSEAKAAVTGTVESVKEAVQGTVESVKESVSGTVETVKETFDLPRQVERHPWAMVGASVAAGYLAGYLLSRGRPHGPAAGWRGPSWSSSQAAGLERLRSEEPPAPPARPGGALGGLGHLFGDELEKLKGLAIGMALGAIRDAVTSSMPPEVGPRIAEVMNDVTTKLGGQTMPSPVLPEGFFSRRDPFEARERAGQAEGAVRWAAR